MRRLGAIGLLLAVCLILGLLGPLDVARVPRLRVLPFLDVVLVWNPGISFGMLQSGSSFAPWLLTGFAVIVVIALLIWKPHGLFVRQGGR